ncbi:E3 SUMO-protein ligase PIAS2-like isoform X2 [Cimex lectularius]|uniref:SP-RING-type domain-containing protein n=1 Tax=Cimex lectularius TaxID=79782 RepID=A0A8I6TMR1_CIMLE|nr:E3 SUMO-protein ligase PIAS2-like isoform X2 [Cimex lectularius]
MAESHTAFAPVFHSVPGKRTPMEPIRSYVSNLLKTSHMYDFICYLVPVIILPQKQQAKRFNIKLTLEQANSLALSRDIVIVNGELESKFWTKVVFRVCKAENGRFVVDLPLHLSIKINGQVVIRDQEGPLELTKYFKFNPELPNTLIIEYPKYTTGMIFVSILLVKALSCESMVNNLIVTRTRSKDYTKQKIIKMLENENNDVTFMSSELSLICPLSQTVMEFPCQGISCSHLKCFDAFTYLSLNDFSGKWICPLCKKTTLPSSLVIDGYLAGVINTLKTSNLSCSTVALLKDGSWQPKNNGEQKEVLESDPIAVL